MKVILLEKVRNLGNLGDIVNVKPGYGRNFLIPYGKAVSATPDNVARFEARRADLEKAAADALSRAKERAAQLQGLSVTIVAPTVDERRLFGSIGVREIAAALSERGIEVAKKEIDLPSAGVIRELGKYSVNIQLHSDVSVTIELIVVSE